MSIISYKTDIICSEQDKSRILAILTAERDAWNVCSEIAYELNDNSVVKLHGRFYQKHRKSTGLPAQLLCEVERVVLGAYKSIKSNKHKIDQPAVKSRLSFQTDKNSFTYKNGECSLLSVDGKRIKFAFNVYPKLQSLLRLYKFKPPKVIYQNNKLQLVLFFDIPDRPQSNNQCIGVDLGIVNIAATSEGILYKDKQYLKQKRQLRYLKRCLQSKGTKSAKRHLKQVKCKESNCAKNFVHHLSKRIIQDTQADTIVLENLDVKKLKAKKHKNDNKNRIAQVPFALLLFVVTYKAHLYGKQVKTVNPAYTSQSDHRTGQRDGVRQGGRYIGKDGKVLHADVNAACNIGLRSKLSCSISNYYTGQAVVNQPIVGLCPASH
jgi:IS605 OrfB family transposase